MKSHEESWHRTIKYRIEFLDDISSLHESGDYTNFRQIESLRKNISGDNPKRANGELSYLLKNNPEILTENLDKIKEWDSFGNPVLQSFERENFKIDCSDSVFPPLYDITKIKENLKEGSPPLPVRSSCRCFVPISRSNPSTFSSQEEDSSLVDNKQTNGPK